ncbi:GMC oxidoreductase [Dichomitus squalens]|uniref:GMC oxidoreductase n=1 Tax=Dichomitus squalens TaxID=114155 RepID=A0A4V6MWM5_9APHY|nr:GMC oxidoreductase [Dichomitus squalens]
MPVVSYEELASRSLDYLIVGGGTSGLALAARLSENEDITIAVLEAGEHHAPAPEIDIPGYIGRALGNPKYDWSFTCVPQPNANNRTVRQPRGKGLGGTSLINFTGMFRPSKAEVDALESVLEIEGWNWDTMLHYMKKSETLQPTKLSHADAIKFAADPDPKNHGTNGPIKKSFGPTFYELHAALYDSVQTFGVPRNPDTGSGKNDGSVMSFLSIDATTAKRSHAANAYLEPNLGRKNLLVLTGAHVTKVILKQDGPLQKAIGVEFVKDGTTNRLENVRRDVVLAAGSFQTPQLLELSGIGNPDILVQHGIDVKIDLPGVGENLQDHIGMTTMAELDIDEPTLDDLTNPEFARAQEELYKQGKGFLATIPAQAFVFLSADALGSPEDVAQWRAHADTHCTNTLAKVLPSLRSGLEKQYAVHRQLFDDKEQPQAELLMFTGYQRMLTAPPAKPGARYLSLVCALSRPLSRGTVHIASANPLAPPRIDPNYFGNEADLDLYVHVLQYTLKVLETEPLKRFVKEQIMPRPETLAKGREGLVEYIRENCRQVYHPVGTAAMMLREDGGVVDSKLTVYGTRNLRVVDLSVLPMEFVCHTQSVAYAIGEQAADILKSELLGSHN